MGQNEGGCTVRSLLPLIALVSGCLPITIGDGNQKTETRSLSGFTAVDNRSSIPVTVTKSGGFSVTVTADQNLLPLITTQVIGDALVIDQVHDLDTHVASEIVVTLPVITAISSSGSGGTAVAGLTGESLPVDSTGSGAVSVDGTVGTLTITSQGSGAVNLTGEGSDLNATLTGSGGLEAQNFPAGRAEISVTGAGGAQIVVNGDATLSTTGSGSIEAALDGGMARFEVTGSGSIIWSGQTTVVSVLDTGSGSVIKQ
jgi:hypothetical protein